jgi:pyruvate-ferredoxin/flavodoxin oxidoreductase
LVTGACAGCGETPYLKLLTQIQGDRLLVANATGCSSIYGGNLPTTPWAVNAAGRGPAWSNSLFEDNAEFGLGMRLSQDQKTRYARDLVARNREFIGNGLADSLLAPDAAAQPREQRERVEALRAALAGSRVPELRDLHALADALVDKSVWVIGGDGWAYDIGFGGLDHVLASGAKVRVLVLDTEVYSNTGGQASKSTPRGAVARFASGGKRLGKKDLGLTAINYGHVYVASVAMGANDMQTLKAFREAEAFPGPSLIIAYSHCIAHGYDMSAGLRQQKLAVDSGHWILYRYNPLLREEGKNPLQIDSREAKIPLQDYLYNESRYKSLVKADPETAAHLLEQSQEAVRERWALYRMLASEAPTRDVSAPEAVPSVAPAASAGTAASVPGKD